MTRRAPRVLVPLLAGLLAAGCPPAGHAAPAGRAEEPGPPQGRQGAAARADAPGTRVPEAARAPDRFHGGRRPPPPAVRVRDSSGRLPQRWAGAAADRGAPGAGGGPSAAAAWERRHADAVTELPSRDRPDDRARTAASAPSTGAGAGTGAGTGSEAETGTGAGAGDRAGTATGVGAEDEAGTVEHGAGLAGRSGPGPAASSPSAPGPGGGGPGASLAVPLALAAGVLAAAGYAYAGRRRRARTRTTPHGGAPVPGGTEPDERTRGGRPSPRACGPPRGPSDRPPG